MTLFRYGKHAPKNDYRTLRFQNYLKSAGGAPALAAPPAQFSGLDQVYQKLGINDPTVLFPMDGNDVYGDCTIAALAHAATVFNGRIGKKLIMSKASVVKTYMSLTHGIDSGLNELDVLNYWQSSPKIPGGEILAFAKIDPKNHEHVQQAICMLGGVYLGFQVQQNCQEEFQARQPWTPGPLTNDGHAVFAVAYDQAGLTVLTWGNTQQATWAWWDECVDEAYAVLPMEAKNPAYAPGLDLAQLQVDLQAVAN